MFYKFFLNVRQERGILPKHYTRVPSIARTGTASSSLAQECASNATLLTNVSPFNSQVALIAQKQAQQPEPLDEVRPAASLDPDEHPQQHPQQQQQQHYYAENLRNNHHKALNGSQIYDPLRAKHGELDYKHQLDPLLRKDELASDTRNLMDSQDFKKPETVVRMAVSQFEKEKKKPHYYLSQVSASLYLY